MLCYLEGIGRKDSVTESSDRPTTTQAQPLYNERIDVVKSNSNLTSKSGIRKWSATIRQTVRPSVRLARAALLLLLSEGTTSE